MSIGFRFGRRIPLPSTAQIRHELIAVAALDDGRKKRALEDGLLETASWDEIGVHRAEIERKALAGQA